MTQINIKQNIHKHRTQNFRRISPFSITPIKKEGEHRTETEQKSLIKPRSTVRHCDVTIGRCVVSDRNLVCVILIRHSTLTVKKNTAPIATILSHCRRTVSDSGPEGQVPILPFQNRRNDGNSPYSPCLFQSAELF